MEMFTDRLRTELEIDEGCKYHIYLDHLGLPTAGIGHLLKGTDPEYNKPVGTVVSKERVAEWFEQDVQTTLSDCKKVYNDWDNMNEEVRLITGFEQALLGIYRYGGQASVPVYSYLRLVELMVKDGVSEEDAVSYVDSNILTHLQQ